MPRGTQLPPTSEREPTPLYDWDVYLVRRSPAQLVTWVKASDADRAVKQVAREFGKDAKRLIAVRRR
jgi:hypothetical protein